MRRSNLDRFKSIADFHWAWPKQCDREMVELWFELGFMEGANNLILCGPNGVGKTIIAKNIGFQSVLKGHTALFITAADMLTDLADLDSDRALRTRIKNYAQPSLLIPGRVDIYGPWAKSTSFTAKGQQLLIRACATLQSSIFIKVVLKICCTYR